MPYSLDEIAINVNGEEKREDEREESGDNGHVD